MVDFITITHQDTGHLEDVNVDAIETMVLTEPEDLPDVEETTDDTVTQQHVGYCSLTLRSGRKIAIQESPDDLRSMLKSPNGGHEATRKLAKAREEKLEKLRSDRVKARVGQESKELEAEHEAKLKEHETAAAALEEEAKVEETKTHRAHHKHGKRDK